MASSVDALALSPDAEAFGGNGCVVERVENGLSLATAEKNGLDGTDVVVTHPVSADASTATTTNRRAPAGVAANRPRAIAASQEGNRTPR